jgi:hypothetical protein
VQSEKGRSKFTKPKTSKNKQLRGTTNGHIFYNISNKIYYTPLATLQHESLWKAGNLIRVLLVQTN